MTEQEFKNNLENCSKNELIEMMIIQWRGLGEFVDQMKMTVPHNCKCEPHFEMPRTVLCSRCHETYAPDPTLSKTER